MLFRRLLLTTDTFLDIIYTHGTMSHFEPNAILRGAQLTVVGALRALKNPSLFTSEHYKQAALAVLAGIVIRILVAIPVCILVPFQHLLLQTRC